MATSNQALVEKISKLQQELIKFQDFLLEKYYIFENDATIDLNDGNCIMDKTTLVRSPWKEPGKKKMEIFVKYVLRTFQVYDIATFNMGIIERVQEDSWEEVLNEFSTLQTSKKRKRESKSPSEEKSPKKRVTKPKKSGRDSNDTETHENSRNQAVSLEWSFVIDGKKFMSGNIQNKEGILSLYEQIRSFFENDTPEFRRSATTDTENDLVVENMQRELQPELLEKHLHEKNNDSQSGRYQEPIPTPIERDLLENRVKNNVIDFNDDDFEIDLNDI